MKVRTSKELGNIAVECYKSLILRKLTLMEITIIIALMHNIDGINDTMEQITEANND